MPRSKSLFSPRLFFLLLAFCLASVSVNVAATPDKDWPTYRGAQRTAVSLDQGLLQDWPKEGPTLLWDGQGAGKGYASLAIAGDKIITLGDGISLVDKEDKDEYLTCFDRATGKNIWKHKTGKPWEEGSPTWRSSRSTPTIDGELTFVLTPFGDLICCKTATGDEVWRKNLKTDFDGKKADGWGYSESVTVDGDKLICTPGNEANTMVALNKKDGALIWKSSRQGDRGAGHASVVISKIGPVQVYVQTTGSGAMGVRSDDGKLLWTYDIDQTTAVIPTPIVRGDLVFFSAGYKRGGALLKQISKPDGDVGMEEIYPLQKDLANKHGGIVMVGDYLFGDSDDQGLPFCADFMTGEIKWKSCAAGKGSAAFAAADGCIYIHFADGTMVLAKAIPGEYKETGAFQVPGSGERPSWSHPVVVDGKMYLREQDHILCYDVRTGGAKPDNAAK